MRFILAIFILMWSVPSFAEDSIWAFGGVGSGNKSQVIEMADIASAKKTGPYTQVWIASIHYSDQERFNFSAKQLIEYDCVNKRIKTLYAIIYPVNGEPSSKTFNQNWEPVVPQSLGHNTFTVACRFSQPRLLPYGYDPLKDSDRIRSILRNTPG